jgi:hypothetical protein
VVPTKARPPNAGRGAGGSRLVGGGLIEVSCLTSFAALGLRWLMTPVAGVPTLETLGLGKDLKAGRRLTGCEVCGGWPYLRESFVRLGPGILDVTISATWSDGSDKAAVGSRPGQRWCDLGN